VIDSNGKWVGDPTNLVGPKGDKGDRGPRGYRGYKGATGATGATGSKGDTGATGPKGSKGSKGNTGATGPAGSSGSANIVCSKVIFWGSGIAYVGAASQIVASLEFDPAALPCFGNVSSCSNYNVFTNQIGYVSVIYPYTHNIGITFCKYYD
jgi:hypothetical protein